MNQDIFNCFTNGNYSNALDIAKENSICPENDPYTSNILAACLFRLGRYDESYSLLEQLQSSLGDNYNYLSLFGAAARRLGYLEKSEELLSRALRINSEDPALRNNYANLLIDLGRLSESRTILLDLIEKNPDHLDARVNFNRLELYEKKKSESAQNSELKSNISTSIDLGSAQDLSNLDPLALAFAEEEVRLHGRIKPKSSKSNTTLSDQIPAVDDKKIALEKLRLAEIAIKEKNPDLALSLCSEAYSINGPLPAIYDCAGDAFVQKSSFREAELMYLQVSILDSASIKHFINLTSLASMRGDVELATIYLEKLSSLSPSHPSIDGLKNNIIKTQNSKPSYSFIS